MARYGQKAASSIPKPVKMLLWLLAIVVTVFLIFGKPLIRMFTDLMKRYRTAMVSDKGTTASGATVDTITAEKAEDLAQQLYKLLRGVNESTEAADLFKDEIRTKQDYQRLKHAFGKRTFGIPLFSEELTLEQTLRNEMSNGSIVDQKAYNNIVSHLLDLGIKL